VYRQAGTSGLFTNPLTLGTMRFGGTADEATSFAILDRYVEAGGNFIDTADIYSSWVPGNPAGWPSGWSAAGWQLTRACANGC